MIKIDDFIIIIDALIIQQKYWIVRVVKSILCHIISFGDYLVISFEGVNFFRLTSKGLAYRQRNAINKYYSHMQ